MHSFKQYLAERNLMIAGALTGALLGGGMAYLKNKQKEVWIQLLVTLNRLGCEGNGMSIDRNAMLTGISHGSAYKYQERVF